MGVYIKDMEMPRGGEMIVVFSDGTVHKCLPGIKEELEKSEAVPVSPHGRLGDLGRIERIMSEWEQVTWDRKALQMLRDCINLAKAAPTIIPAEEGE